MSQYDLSGNPLPEDNAPKTDLSGNPMPASPAPPPGMNPPPSAVWPPPPTSQPGYGQPAVNTSGTKGDIPPEIAALKWNWGAFLLSFLWTVNHKMSWGWGLLVLGLLSNIPFLGILFSLVSLGIAIYLGLNGHKLGWQNRRFEGGMSEFIAVQQKWLIWGVGVVLVGFVLGFIGALAGGLSSSLPGSGGRVR